MSTDIIEDVGAELVPAPAAQVNLFDTSDPNEALAKAGEVADALAGVLKKAKLTVKIGSSAKPYVLAEGWTCLGSLMGVFPRTVWTRKLEDGGWEARVDAVTLTGAVVGAAESQCTRTEKAWANRDDYALRSMAQTRAMSKALRMPLGFIVVLAGFEATPADEMPRDTAGVIEGEAEKILLPGTIVLPFGKHQGETIGNLADTDRGYIEWLANPEKYRPKTDEQAKIQAAAAAFLVGEDVPF